MIVAVFDTETTGLPFHAEAKDDVQPRIIEFGGVLWDVRRDEIIDELELLVNPGQPLEAIITKITGLTDDDLKDAPRFPDVEPRLRSFFARAEGVVAHNLPFDRTLMFMELLRMGIPPSAWVWPKRELCTVQEHAEAWGRRPKLLELYEHYTGNPLAQKHRALDDVKALLDVVRASGVFA